eukprot:SAG31_NODE_4714_length_3012_cov_26.602815_4_plen_85_part_00
MLYGGVLLMVSGASSTIRQTVVVFILMLAFLSVSAAVFHFCYASRFERKLEKYDTMTGYSSPAARASRRTAGEVVFESKTSFMA